MRFAAFLDSHEGRLDPQLWPPDQRSINLAYLRANDPPAYAALFEQLRSGRLERIERRKP